MNGETMCECGHRFEKHVLERGCTECACQIPRACDVWPAPFKQFGPGFYHDPRDNSLHLDIPAVLRHLGCDDTPANRDMCTQIALEIFGEAFPNVPQKVL